MFVAVIKIHLAGNSFVRSKLSLQSIISVIIREACESILAVCIPMWVEDALVTGSTFVMEKVNQNVFQDSIYKHWLMSTVSFVDNI